MDVVNNLKDRIEKASTYSKSKSDAHGEVFTPFDLIADMVKKIPLTTLTDPSKTYFDPCAGKGNFPIILVKALMKTLAKAIPDESDRLKHIIENQLFMGEYQDTSANFIAYHFQMDRGLKVNLYKGDSLQMPDDFFDLSYDERREKYPEHSVLEPVEPEKVPEIPVNTPSLPLSQGVSKAKPSQTSAKPKKSPQIKGEKPDMTMTFIDVQVDPIRNSVIIKVERKTKI